MAHLLHDIAIIQARLKEAPLPTSLRSLYYMNTTAAGTSLPPLRNDEAFRNRLQQRILASVDSKKSKHEVRNYYVASLHMGGSIQRFQIGLRNFRSHCASYLWHLQMDFVCGVGALGAEIILSMHFLGGWQHFWTISLPY